MPSLGGGGRYGGDDPSGGASRASGGYGLGGGTGAGGTRRDKKKSVRLGEGKKATVSVTPTITAPMAITTTAPTTPAAPRQRLGASSTPVLGDEDALSLSPMREMKGIKEQLGPGKVEDGKFQPARGPMGSLRDLMGYEREVSPQLAGQAAAKGVLGELTGSLRSGNVQTREGGTKAAHDPLGQALSVTTLATDIMGLPSPTQFQSPLGALTGSIPAVQAVAGVASFMEEQQQLSALSGAGFIPVRERGAAHVVDRGGRGGPPVLGSPVIADTPTVTQQAAAAIKPGFDDELTRKARQRGFGSTRRTGVYGITGPLAVRA